MKEDKLQNEIDSLDKDINKLSKELDTKKEKRIDEKSRIDIMESSRIVKAGNILRNQKINETMRLWEEGFSLEEISKIVDMQRDEIYLIIFSCYSQSDQSKRNECKEKHLINLDGTNYIDSELKITRIQKYTDGSGCYIVFENKESLTFHMSLEELAKKLGYIIK